MFCAKVGQNPSRILTDFDHKLCGKKVLDYFADNKNGSCIIESAPLRHQDKNGLAKRNWATILQMACRWLVSALLRSEYWYYEIKRAVEVSNYVLIKIDNIITTPHELTYGHNPDLHCLFLQFSIAYINKIKDSNHARLNLNNQSL